MQTLTYLTRPKRGNFTANKKSYQFAKCKVSFWYLIPPNGSINEG